MNKPFDIKVLTEKFKALGLPVIESTVEKMLEVTFAWCNESAAIHPNAIIKVAIPLAVQTIQPALAKEVDKIDGIEG